LEIRLPWPVLARFGRRTETATLVRRWGHGDDDQPPHGTEQEAPASARDGASYRDPLGETRRGNAPALESRARGRAWTGAHDGDGGIQPASGRVPGAARPVTPRHMSAPICRAAH